jgi:hypothetical protein
MTDQQPEPKLSLGPDDTGSWLITTQGSRHLLELDHGLRYTRLPGEGRLQLAYDGVPVQLTRIEQWPAVGGSMLIWFDEPTAPLDKENWIQTSTIKAIEPWVGEG